MRSTLKPETPPENEIGSSPSNSADSFAAMLIDKGKRARPDIYISVSGRIPLRFLVPKIFVNFTPKCTFAFYALFKRFEIILTASSNWRSFWKDSFSIPMYEKPRFSSMLFTLSYPRRVGFSFTKVFNLFKLPN